MWRSHSACAQVEVLAHRAGPLECREAGARLATSVALRDLNLDLPASDGRRTEVVANGLPLWRGVPIAIDTKKTQSGAAVRCAQAVTGRRGLRNKQRSANAAPTPSCAAGSPARAVPPRGFRAGGRRAWRGCSWFVPTAGAGPRRGTGTVECGKWPLDGHGHGQQRRGCL